MEIRHTKETDILAVMKIYAHARQFQAEHGNPNQWGPTNWPPEELIRKDIDHGNSYVVIENHNIVGVFFYESGFDIEPTYRVIDGAWKGGENYGVVHRIASDSTTRGTGSFAINWAYEQCHHLRMDTHGDNIVMQNLLTKLGFVPCGIIHVEEDDNPRLAYEKL